MINRHAAKKLLLLSTLALCLGTMQISSQLQTPVWAISVAQTTDIGARNGYDIGYDRGRADRSESRGFNNRLSSVNDLEGFSRRLEHDDAYKRGFHQGYRDGYQAGYYSNRYDRYSQNPYNGYYNGYARYDHDKDCHTDRYYRQGGDRYYRGDRYDDGYPDYRYDNRSYSNSDNFYDDNRSAAYGSAYGSVGGQIVRSLFGF